MMKILCCFLLCMMLMKYDGAGLWTTDADLAERWGVCVAVIRREQERIRAGIRKAVRG